MPKVRGKGLASRNSKAVATCLCEGSWDGGPHASGVKTTPGMKRAFGPPGLKLEPHFFAYAPGTLTTGHKTTVILQDGHPERLSFRAERSVVEESASRFIRWSQRQKLSQLQKLVAFGAPASIQLLRHRNLRLTQHVLHLRLPQPRSVILKRQFRFRVVQVELAQSISIRKFAQPAQLLDRQR